MEKITKIIHLTDIHFNPLHRIPQSRTAGFHRHVREKWDHICGDIKEQDIDFGILSGDIFHLKNPKRYSPEDINYYSELFEETKIPWVSIPGNHDLPESSFDQIEKSPYNLLIKATDNITSLVKRVKIKDGKTDCYFNVVSYNTEGVYIPINLYGLPYYPLDKTISLLPKINDLAKEKSGFNVLLLHMDVLVDPNIFLFWPVAGYDSVLNKIPNIDLVCLGHIHQSFPVYKRTNPDTNRVQLVSKPWSFTRVAKDYFNKTDIYEKLHKPSYSLIKIIQGDDNFNVSVEYKEIPFAPFDKAFKKEVLKKQMENSIVIKNFIDEVKASFGSVQNAFNIVDPNEYLQKVEMSQELRDFLNKYLEEVE